MTPDMKAALEQEGRRSGFNYTGRLRWFAEYQQMTPRLQQQCRSVNGHEWWQNVPLVIEPPPPQGAETHE